MAFKKDSWLVRGVLIVAVAAFVAVPILFAFNGRSYNGGANTASTPTAADQTTQLQSTVEAYKKVLEREPENETALIGIIEAQIALGDLSGTVEPLEKLANLKPEVPEYSIALAQTKQQLGELEGAAQIYRRVLTQVPGNVQALEGLVALLVSQDRTEAAVGLLRDTLTTADQTNELSPGSVDKLSVKLLLGQVLVEQQKYDDALKLYDEAIADAQAASPTLPDFRPTLAKALVLQEQGDKAAAKGLFDQALSMAPVQYKDGVQQLINEKTASPGAATDSTPPAAPTTAPETSSEGNAPVAPPAE
ncbi:MAG: tetratricopeptide repeat protein [Phormidesmis sp. RL_2_1]|nr:tetratricopeptide repeat protein [Phormidesmis sp. RL_2_1]